MHPSYENQRHRSPATPVVTKW
jgi:hypothetical protein